MSGIYGALGLNTTDSDYVFVNTFGQQSIYDAANFTLMQFTEDVNAATRVFIDQTTDAHIERYWLAGGGRLQRLDENSQAAAVKASGSWDTAYPLEEFGAKMAKSRVGWAYMTLSMLDRHLDTIAIQNENTIRFEILKAIFNGSTRTFVDPEWGSLTCQPLANGDSIVYPPVLGSETDATENNYLASGYASASISNTNDPFPTIVDQLEKHFGTPTGGSKIVVFANSADRNVITALAEFTAVTNIHINPGDDVNTVQLLDGEGTLPGRVIGVHQASGALIVVWQFIPSGYLLGVHMMAPRPLKKRIDPASTKLGTGLQLVAESNVHPFTESHYSNRFGVAVGNRLNGVCMKLTTGSWAAPTIYA